MNALRSAGSKYLELFIVSLLSVVQRRICESENNFNGLCALYLGRHEVGDNLPRSAMGLFWVGTFRHDYQANKGMEPTAQRTAADCPNPLDRLNGR